MLLLLLATMIVGCSAGPLAEDMYGVLLRRACQTTLERGGASPYFARNVAHRLHSLTLEDIRFYFKSDASTENGVPTVNKDLESDQRVLGDAPLAGMDMTFSTLALRYFDMVLRNMDEAHYSITNFSILEKLAHVYHMAELWQHASVHYASLLLNPPTREMCSCTSDFLLNAITQELELLALKIKYPGITSGDYLGNEGGFNDYGYGIHYSYGKTQDPSPDFQRVLAGFDFSGPEEDVVARVAEELVDEDRGMEKNLVNEEGWEYWKEKVQSMDEAGNYEFALFMYCRLNV